MLFGGYLKGISRLDAGGHRRMEREIADEIAEEFEFALASPNPTEADLHQHVYAE
jgi:TPP-dependent pyruvate/acetoin dehydrogenase alpha subunit